MTRICWPVSTCTVGASSIPPLLPPLVSSRADPRGPGGDGDGLDMKGPWTGARKERWPMRHATDGDLIYAVHGAIGLVTFNRPLAHNALTFEMYDRLGEICASVPADGSLRVLIITGAGGRAFSAGTDISLFRTFRSAAEGLAYEERLEST